MADTGTATYASGIEEHQGFKRLVVAWTSTAGGAVEKTIGLPLGGYVSRLTTIPSGSAAPTDNYDITWEDDQGVDFLQALGANRDTANTETAAIQLTNGLPVPVYAPRTVFKVATAGNAKSGTAILYWK